MKKEDLKQKEQCIMHNTTCNGYVVRFNEPDLNGNIIMKEAINLDNFQQMKIRGEIIDYEIDENGVKIIKKLNITSISL